MNQPVRNDLFDILTVANPTPEPFEIYYNSELNAVIPPMKAIQLVKLIAGDSNNGAIKHLIDRCCRLQGVSKNDPKARAAWLAKILINTQSSTLPKAMTIEDQAIQLTKSLQTEPLNAPAGAVDPVFVKPIDKSGWRFDPITGERLVEKKTVLTPDSVNMENIEIQTANIPTGATVPMPPAPHSDPTTNSLIENIRQAGKDEGRIIGEVPAVDEPPAPESETAVPHTREAYIDYAKNTLKMDVDGDADTKKFLDEQPLDVIKKELGIE